MADTGTDPGLLTDALARSSEDRTVALVSAGGDTATVRVTGKLIASLDPVTELVVPGLP